MLRLRPQVPTNVVNTGVMVFKVILLNNGTIVPHG
jgi:hypothetical protein